MLFSGTTLQSDTASAHYDWLMSIVSLLSPTEDGEFEEFAVISYRLLIGQFETIANTLLVYMRASATFCTKCF